MRKLKRLQPHELLSIGDELRDLEAARSEHIPLGAVARGYSRLDALTAMLA